MEETTTIALYIAANNINNMMSAMDMRPNHKVFITDKQIASFKTKTLVNDKYFLKIIEKSKANKDFWIPAIEHEGVLYVSPEIMEISDGQKILFTGRE